jgi:hypothetical protein
MSRISKYKAKVADLNSLQEACEQLGFEFKLRSTVRMYGSNKVDAVASVKLPGWRYEVAIDANGQVYYDHFGSESTSFDRMGEMIQTANVVAETNKAIEAGVYNYWVDEVEEPGVKGKIKELVLEFE